MKLSMTPISVSATIRDGKMDLDGFVDFCAKLNLHAVDLLDSKCYPWLWRDFPSQSKTLPARLQSAGLKMAAYGCGNNFAKHDRAELNEQVGRVENALIEAASVGAPVLRVFGGYMIDAQGKQVMGYGEGFARVLEGLERCLPLAEKHGVVMALENHGRLPGHSYEILAILDRFSSPWLQCLFDCGNFMAHNMDEPEDPLRAYEALRGRIAHVHFKDFGPPTGPRAACGHAPKVEGYVAGEGDVPLRQLLARFARDEYHDYYSLEYEASFKVPEVEGITHSFAYMRQAAELIDVLSPLAKKR